MDSSENQNYINKPKIICLTPVKNEAWILNHFLVATSLWADHIIIADQMSTDGSREIALKFSKVTLIENPSEKFNEPERQKLLINEARKISGQRLLITLDADEFFSPEIYTSDEWLKVISAEPGTIINFQWANLTPDLKKMWFGAFTPWGYMDDGSKHDGANKIHSGRIPLPEHHNHLNVNSIKVIHLQYVNWERMESKQRWYQCYERITYPEMNSTDVFRRYHHMYGLHHNDFVKIPSYWFSEFKKFGIELNFPISDNDLFWFDQKVLDLFDEYGVCFFKRLRIWNVNWKNLALNWSRENADIYKDPRNLIDKLIQWWLLKTQIMHKTRIIRKIDNVVKKYY
jgi:hypothetical protein